VSNLISGELEESAVLQEGMSISMELQKVVKKTQSELEVSVKRKAGGGEIHKLKFVVYSEDKSETFENDTKLDELESENFILTLTKFTTNDVKKVAILPILITESGKEISLNIKDEKEHIEESGSCGNGAVESGEACDDGNTNNCDGCRGDCSRVDDDCGDGIVECGEACDDGNTDETDGCYYSCVLEGSCPGDANGDLSVDIMDVLVMQNYWYQSCFSPSWCEGSDFNKDGSVDNLDYSILQDHYLTVC
jgi:cysteine-rich repeat protein